MHQEDIPWQQAVYTRKGPRDIFTFSHSNTTHVKKSFPSALSIPHLGQLQDIHGRNLEEFRQATVLVLVTGGWAFHVSIAAFQGNNFNINRLPVERYDHLDRLGALDSAECNELTKAYRALKYHCTMTSYEAGEAHSWELKSVAPVLSDIVILPKLLEETRLKAVMSSFCRATRKALRDSLILAGGGSVREEAWGSRK
jgi:hypothetical protein